MTNETTNTKTANTSKKTNTPRKPRKAAAKRTAARKVSKPSAKVSTKKVPRRATVGVKKIKLLVRKNPHATGSNRAKKFACLKSGWTVNKVKETMKAKGLRTPGGYLTYAVANKLIEIAK